MLEKGDTSYQNISFQGKKEVMEMIYVVMEILIKMCLIKKMIFFYTATPCFLLIIKKKKEKKIIVKESVYVSKHYHLHCFVSKENNFKWFIILTYHNECQGNKKKTPLHSLLKKDIKIRILSLFKFSDAILYSTVRNSSLNLRGSRQNRWDTGNKYCIYCTKGSFSRQHLFKIMKYKRYKYLNILHCTKEIKDNFNQWQPTRKRNFSQSLPHPVQFKYIFFHEYSSFLKKKKKKRLRVLQFIKRLLSPPPHDQAL